MPEFCGRFARGHFAHHGATRQILPAVLLMLLVLPACQQSNQSATPPPTHQDIWEAFYLQGTKIGYGHTTERPVVRNGQSFVQVDALNHLEMTRFGQSNTQNVTMTTLETPTGDVVEFTTEVAFGPAPTIVSGHVEGDEMVITTKTEGRMATNRIDWPAGVRGFRGVEQSLAEKPFKPREKRTLKMLVPLVNQVADVELTAGEREVTSVLGVDVQLLRVESVARLPGGQSIDTTLWTDEQGEVIKSRVAALQQESFRTTESLAVARGTGGQFDLGLDLFVEVDPPLEHPHQTREVRYRVELDDGDPAKIFATGPTQSVKSLGPHVAEVTVRSLRPQDVRTAPAPQAEPGGEYTAANSVLQIDDPELVRMAREGQGDAKSPREVALALERYVHEVVDEKNFSHGFATAAEVAKTHAGDCTEHAVLLAALARLCGLPSRVAIGLVYVERAAGFGYHMWTEVYLDGAWVPLDAVVAGGGTSAAYLKLNDSSLEGASAYSSFLSVAQVLGQLKVQVLSAE